MKESVFGFLIIGCLVGCVVGIVEGLIGLPINHPILHVLASSGLHGLVGGLSGAIFGLVHTTVPVPLHLTHHVRMIRRTLWPSGEDSLQSRCQASATIWVSALMLSGLVSLVWDGYRHLMTRIQSTEFAALGVALFGLFVISLGLAFTAPIRSSMARLSEGIVRRRPDLTFLVHPILNLLVALGLMTLLILSSGVSDQNLWSLVPWRPILLGLTLLVFTGLLGEWLAHHLVRLPWAQCIQLSMVAFFIAGGLAIAGLRSVTVCESLSRDVGINQAILGLIRLPFDGDGDGYSSALGGGDCDDSNPNIHPGAVELSGNEIDENCDGDLVVVTTEPAGLQVGPVPLKDLGFQLPYSVILITVDGLKADHLGFYGYDRATSPGIDRLAAESVVFKKAYTASPDMAASIAAIHTGRFPSELNRLHGDRALDDAYWEENTFLAEALEKKGYYTAAFLSHSYLNRPFGLKDGFAKWQPHGVERSREPFVPSAETVVSAAVEHLPILEPNPTQPYFFWLHVIDPQPQHLNHLDIPVFGGRPVDRYDHEVRYVDTWLDWFFDTLRKRNDWDRMVVIVAGTRGYSFGPEPKRELSDALTRVPLIIRIPGLPARPVNSTVSLIDIVPTVLDLAGLEPQTALRQSMGLSGVSLISDALGRKTEPRPAFTELSVRADRSNHVAWRTGSYTLQFSSTQGRWSLFDVEKDPDETRDVIEIEPQISAQLRRELRRYRSNLSVIQSDCRAALGRTVSEGWWCKKLGRCTPKDGRCVAESEEDCRASDGCIEQGLCALESMACVARSESDCMSSLMCREQGRCSPEGGQCIALDDADCSQAKVCTDSGQCIAVDGQCTRSLDLKRQE